MCSEGEGRWSTGFSLHIFLLCLPMGSPERGAAAHRFAPTPAPSSWLIASPDPCSVSTCLSLSEFGLGLEVGPSGGSCQFTSSMPGLHDVCSETGHHNLMFPNSGKSFHSSPNSSVEASLENSSLFWSELAKKSAFPHLGVRGGKSGHGPEARAGVSGTGFQSLSPGPRAWRGTQQGSPGDHGVQSENERASRREKTPGGRGL